MYILYIRLYIVIISIFNSDTNHFIMYVHLILNHARSYRSQNLAQKESYLLGSPHLCIDTSTVTRKLKTKNF